METQYGEMVFDSLGYVVGCIWKPTPNDHQHGNQYRAKVWYSDHGFLSSMVTLKESREEAIAFIQQKISE